MKLSPQRISPMIVMLGLGFLLAALAIPVEASEPSPYLCPRADVGLFVSDLAASTHFYRDGQSFAAPAGAGDSVAAPAPKPALRGAGRVVALEATESATRIRLVEIPADQASESNQVLGRGGSYLTLYARDLDRIVKQMADEGFAPAADVPGGVDVPGRSVSYRDPDGNLVEVVERVLSGYHVHDPQRPRPAVLEPPAPGEPPADAVVLFDGTDLSQWTNLEGQPPQWKVEDGAVLVVPKTGDIRSKREFGDCQVHVEWMSPPDDLEPGQKGGNSGVFLMGIYEVQVLNSYQNPTYADGQAGSLYGQVPPLVNVCRPAGQWQSYDISFLRPLFDAHGLLVRPGRITVLHNGVVVQNNYVLEGTTYHKQLAHYTAHKSTGPLVLQNHGDAVRFRNIWVRPLQEFFPSVRECPEDAK